MTKSNPQTEAAAVYVDPGTLTPWEQNPRDNEEAIEQVARSIERFGFASPIVARQADGRIIAGHTRHAAALRLGLTDVPVRFLDLDEQMASALALADNRMGEIASWDDDSLREVLNDLESKGVDLTCLGWGDDLPEFEDEPDYSFLDEDDDDDEFLDGLSDGVRKAIQIEFESMDYEEARELIGWWRRQGAYLGGMLIEHLKIEKAKA